MQAQIYEKKCLKKQKNILSKKKAPPFPAGPFFN
jgi:hypothetical protein